MSDPVGRIWTSLALVALVMTGALFTDVALWNGRYSRGIYEDATNGIRSVGHVIGL